MITKDQTTSTAMPWIGALLLMLGVALGWMIGAAVRRPGIGSPDGGPAALPPATLGPFAPDPGVPLPAAGGLETLHVDLSAEHAAVLQQARQRAVAQGVIDHRESEVVPATVRLGERAVPAEIRLKGDFTDHVDSDKWSLRIELSEELLGMKRFSIQHPKTRGWLMEWLMMALARREGLLAPRSTFVHVVVNGRPSGVYYLEEHFAKELLEAQGRREGPIVRFDEDTLWTTWLQYGFPREPVPAPIAFATTPDAAGVGAYSEKRMTSSKSLNLRLQRALQMMRELQLRGIASSNPDKLVQLDALLRLQGNTVEELFAAEKLGRMLALYALVPADHGLAWHTLRFYHDPVLDRLEPILFNTGARLELPPRDLGALVPLLGELARSDRAYEELFRAAGRFARPDYVPRLLSELGTDLRRFEAALRAEGELPADAGVEAISARLRQSSERLHQVVLPRDPANFACRLLSGEEGAGEAAETIEIEAWATTAVPVVVDSFRFGDGRVVPAARALPAESLHRRRGERVMLPRAGRHLVLRLPADARLSGLHDVDDVKRAIRARTEPDRSVKLQLEVAFASIAAEQTTVETLPIRRVEPATRLGDGRPAAPSLRDALERHACLGYSFELDRLVLREGTWDIDGDLVIPDGYELSGGPGVTLRFAKDCVFVTSSPLRLAGIEGQPIVLEAQDPAGGWGGLVVADAEGRSALEHVAFRRATEIVRGGWQTTGGITFYRSPVDLRHVRFEDARGEDALNVFGTEMTMQRCSFAGGTSDLLDCDFVHGWVRDCAFADSYADALDFSGSDITIERCTFERIGDKAMSIGEKTTATARDNDVRGAGIAVAAKDLSDVTIDGLRVGHADHYALAAYVKKPEFGPSRIAARRLEIGMVGRGRYLVQEGCVLEVDGAPIPGEPVDVQALYEQQILGR